MARFPRNERLCSDQVFVSVMSSCISDLKRGTHQVSGITWSSVLRIHAQSQFCGQVGGLRIDLCEQGISHLTGCERSRPSTRCWIEELHRRTFIPNAFAIARSQNTYAVRVELLYSILVDRFSHAMHVTSNKGYISPGNLPDRKLSVRGIREIGTE